MYSFNKKTADAAALAVLAAAFAWVAFYTLALQKLEFHSDFTDTLYWAWASLKSKSLFNSDFNYACALPFGGQWFMLPFAALFGLSFKAHSLGMLFFAVVFTAALFWLLRAADLSVVRSSLSCAVVLMLLSSNLKLRELFWGHIIYYSLGCLFFLVGMALLFSIKRSGEPATRRVIAAFSALMAAALLCAANGATGLIFFNIPFFAALTAVLWLDRKSEAAGDKKALILPGAFLAATAVGYLLGKWLTRNVEQPYADGNTVILPISTWAKNASSFLPSWFKIITGKNINEIFAPLTFAGVAMFIVFIALTVLPIIALFYMKGSKSYAFRFASLFHLFECALIFGAFTVSKAGGAFWRTSPLVCSASIVCVLLFGELSSTKAKIPARAVSIACLAAIFAVSLSTFAGLTVRYPSCHKGEQIEEVLRSNNLEHGYAEFWTSQELTVLSGGIIIAPVDQTTFVPYKYQSFNSWYETDTENAESFYIYSSNAGADLLFKQRRLLQTAKMVLEAEGCTILVFDYNMSDYDARQAAEKASIWPGMLSYSNIVSENTRINDAMLCGLDEMNESGVLHLAGYDVEVSGEGVIAFVGWCVNPPGNPGNLYLRIGDNCWPTIRTERSDINEAFGLPASSDDVGFGCVVDISQLENEENDVSVIYLDSEAQTYIESPSLAHFTVKSDDVA